jgi:dolichyl-phosphate beta-glucosyltransferase
LNPHLSVVIPCYNEAGKVENDIRAALEYFGSQPYSFELILVDDGSADGTGPLLEAACRAAGPHARAICYRPNRGKGCAVRTGMLQATGRYRLFADAGLCVPYSETGKGLSLLETGADVAIASRKLAQSQVTEKQAGYRRIGSSVFGLLVRGWMGLRYSDTQCGFKLFTASAARALFGEARVDRFAWDVEILYLARRRGLPIAEVPVLWFNSPESKVRVVRDAIQTLWDVARIRWIHRGR